jgi:hypothetical protein
VNIPDQINEIAMKPITVTGIAQNGRRSIDPATILPINAPIKIQNSPKITKRLILNGRREVAPIDCCGAVAVAITSSIANAIFLI